MRREPHVRFGGRAEETDRLKGRHRASTRPLHLRLDRCAASCYTAFVVDAFSRAIVGWRVIDQPAGRARPRRPRDGDLGERARTSPGLVHHSDRGRPVPLDPLYRAPRRGGARSPRSAAAATVTTTPSPRRSTACTRPSSSTGPGPWRTVEQVELATADWVDFWNTGGSTRPAATSRRRSTRPPTMPDGRRAQPPDSNRQGLHETQGGSAPASTRATSHATLRGPTLRVRRRSLPPQTRAKSPRGRMRSRGPR